MRETEVEERLCRAVEQLLGHDRYLLVHDANERAITHKLAVHVAEAFAGWDVDCEFNRDGHDPKRRLLPDRGRIASDDVHAQTVFPDVIVHRRGQDGPNLLVIEAKKSTNRDTGDWDHLKLRAFQDGPLAYEHAAFVVVTTDGEDVSASVEMRGSAARRVVAPTHAVPSNGRRSE